MLQCVAVCCIYIVYPRQLSTRTLRLLQRVAVCCSVVQCDAAYCSMLQRVAKVLCTPDSQAPTRQTCCCRVCSGRVLATCSMVFLSPVAVCCSVVVCGSCSMVFLSPVAVCCSVVVCECCSMVFLSHVAMCCSVVVCECCSMFQCAALRSSDLYYGVLITCCSVLQCVAVCCSVLQCVAAYIR